MGHHLSLLMPVKLGTVQNAGWLGSEFNGMEVDEQKNAHQRTAEHKFLTFSKRSIEHLMLTAIKRVINLSSPALSNAEVSLLLEDLNFAATSAHMPATEIVSKVESARRTLDSEQADAMRRMLIHPSTG